MKSANVWAKLQLFIQMRCRSLLEKKNIYIHIMTIHVRERVILQIIETLRKLALCHFCQESQNHKQRSITCHTVEGVQAQC